MFFENLEIRKKKKKKVGRGCGSGLGKTCGRGHKGQKSRSGVSISSFEGGQNPIYTRLPKRGFRSRVDKSGRVSITLKRVLDFSERAGCVEINYASLLSGGMIRKNERFIKLVSSDCDLSVALSIKVNSCSSAVRAKIEESGGKIELI